MYIMSFVGGENVKHILVLTAMCSCSLCACYNAWLRVRLYFVLGCLVMRVVAQSGSRILTVRPKSIQIDILVSWVSSPF